MQRCFPRRMRLKWVLFLLSVCFVGLYFTYKKLVESKQGSRKWGHSVDKLPFQRQNDLNQINPLRQRLKMDPKKDRLENGLQPVAAAPLIRNLEADSDYITSEEKYLRFKMLLNKLSPANWKKTLDAGDMMSVVKSELMDMDLVSKMSCQEIDALKLGSAHRSGFYGKKAVDYVMLAYPIELAVKSIGNDHPLKIACMKQDYNADRCTNMANYKLMRELILLLAMDNAAIIEMKGFCLRGETIDPRLNMKGVVIVTEGSRQVPEAFYNHCWPCRLQILLDLLHLLVYMDNSPLGSLGFEQLHANDFVMASSKIKLVDLDNIIIGEKSCQTNKDCSTEEMPRKEFQCIASECQGRNSFNNLLWLSKSILGGILKMPPTSEAREIEWLLEKIQNLELSVAEVIEVVKKYLKKAGREGQKADQAQGIKGGLTIVDQGAESARNRAVVKGENKLNNIPEETANRVRYEDLSKEEVDNNKVLPNRNQDGGQKQYQGMGDNQGGSEMKYEYVRHRNANFPGQFDYTCNIIASRVKWGCVLSVTSLDEAKSFCNRDPDCKSFVVFSSNPEQDALMTMVMKNSADAQPDQNYGATLFIKKKQVKAANPAFPPTLLTPESCKLRAKNQTEKARESRERRLMTHLGLKGSTETKWKHYARVQKIVKVLGKSSLMHNNTIGGRFRLQFAANNTKGISKGEFLAEAGPLQYHVGYLLTYYVDRILGLYHTPPAIVRKIQASEIRAIKGSRSWLSRLAKFNQSDGSGILGVLTVPMPPVMKTSEITIPKRDSMESNLNSFTRDEKVQVEYILLWALTKLLTPQHGYLGYKGHLIHFEADLAFQNARQTFQGYFYSCQFPNTVYKKLVCYKCQMTSHKTSQVCGFGEEVVDSVMKQGIKEDDIKIGSFTSTDLKDIINNSATSILTIVEHCIRANTREKVLY